MIASWSLFDDINMTVNIPSVIFGILAPCYISKLFKQSDYFLLFYATDF